MAFKSYKEGQGIWARGVMAAVVFVVGVYASFRLYDYLYIGEGRLGEFMNLQFSIGLWVVDMRLVFVGVVLLIFLGFGVWAYNFPKFVDFLIETESELRTRVTWPKKHELINASTVVIFTVIIVGLWVLGVDNIFAWIIRENIYRLF